MIQRLFPSRRAPAAAARGAVILVFAAGLTHAQSPGSVVVDVGDCLELEDRAAQLECYEARVEDVLAADPDADPAAAEPARVEPSPAAREPAETAASRPAAESETPDEIVATVTSVRELEPNHLLIVLDNDQVWRQNRPQRFFLEAGTGVTLTSTRWGASYRLKADDANGFIQVERVR